MEEGDFHYFFFLTQCQLFKFFLDYSFGQVFKGFEADIYIYIYKNRLQVFEFVFTRDCYHFIIICKTQEAQIRCLESLWILKFRSDSQDLCWEQSITPPKLGAWFGHASGVTIDFTTHTSGWRRRCTILIDCSFCLLILSYFPAP